MLRDDVKQSLRDRITLALQALVAVGGICDPAVLQQTFWGETAPSRGREQQPERGGDKPRLRFLYTDSPPEKGL